MMKLYAPFIREATLRVTMTLRSEGHGGDPSPKLQALGIGIGIDIDIRPHLLENEEHVNAILELHLQED
jgi:hypothetical protein